MAGSGEWLQPLLASPAFRHAINRVALTPTVFARSTTLDADRVDDALESWLVDGRGDLLQLLASHDAIARGLKNSFTSLRAGSAIVG